MTAEREETFAVGEHPSLDVRCAAGALTVVEGEPGSVGIRVRSRDASAFTVDQAGDRLTLRQDDRRPGRWAQADITARVPAGTDIDVKGASVDVAVEAEASRLRANLASGALRATAVTGDVAVRTASGDIDLGAVGGRLEVTTASGDVRVERLGATGRISTASGDVRANRVDASLAVHTASGDVDIGDFAGDDLSCASMSGDVRVTLPSGRIVDLDLASLSGDVSHAFADAPGETAGGARVKVAVKTISGDIRLRSR